MVFTKFISLNLNLHTEARSLPEIVKHDVHAEFAPALAIQPGRIFFGYQTAI